MNLQERYEEIQADIEQYSELGHRKHLGIGEFAPDAPGVLAWHRQMCQVQSLQSKLKDAQSSLDALAEDCNNEIGDREKLIVELREALEWSTDTIQRTFSMDSGQYQEAIRLREHFEL